MSGHLAHQVEVLRDEVFERADLATGPERGTEVFDAVVRQLVSAGQTSPGLDLALHEAIARRLAWGESEHEVLADADAVCKRLVTAAQRAFPVEVDRIAVVSTTAAVACTAARIVALAVVGRASRERAAARRETSATERLERALARQEARLARLEAARPRAQDGDGA